MPDTIPSKWYEAGLRFTCTQCGNCCTGSPGYVFVTPEEVRKIAEFLGADGPDGPWLDREHLRQVGESYSLTEDRRTGDCCFLTRTVDGRRTCSIYPVRPLQCRTWPFWEANLESPRAWKAAARTCPGMNSGKHHGLVQIEIHRTARRWEDLPA